MDLVIEARALLDADLVDVEIGIDETNGTIVDVKRNLPGTPRKRYRGLVLLPSAVDWHVHFRDPGAPAKEDFATGTRSAALGGVGTVLDMPNTQPAVDRMSHLQEKAEAVARKAVVDWALWATVTSHTRDAFELAHASAGLKLFLAPTTAAEADLTDDQVRVAIESARRAQRWVTAHAESRPATRTERSTRDHDAARPAEAEVAAIERLARLAVDPRHVHVAHATTGQAVAAARKAGLRVASTPHHLLLSYEEAPGAAGKVNPPLRGEAQRRGLWDAFLAGEIDHLESDHAPHTLEEKGRPFHEAPAGVPGVQTMLPLLLARAQQGGPLLSRVVNAACAAPARDLGLPKGRIAKGHDADFFLVDLHAATKVKASELASKAGWTPFEGRPACFPQAHYLRGSLVVEDGEFVGSPGRGRRVQPRFVAP